VEISDQGFDTRPMGQRVYDHLRKSIESQELAPLERIVQERVAEEMSTSRTPVREALNRLIQDGLVTWVAGAGFFVSQLRRKDVEETQHLRRILEVEALRLALPAYTPADIRHLRSIYLEMVEADPNKADYVDLTRRFHQALVGPCPNELLLKHIDEVWTVASYAKVIGRYGETQESVDIMIADHFEIIAALESEDPAAAITLLEEHLASVHTSITHILAEDEV